jgi:hypothetical protein
MAFKPQPTIQGYNAWVLERLVEARATSPAEVTAWIIDRWIEANRQLLAAEYGITRDQFQRAAKVVKLARKPVRQ